jgi:hypothetical protein
MPTSDEAVEEPRVIVEYRRAAIASADDPALITIEFPAHVTITDLLVTLAENQSRYFVYRQGRSSWRVSYSADDQNLRVIGLLQFDDDPAAVEKTQVFIFWGDPYWGRPLTEELGHSTDMPVRIRASSVYWSPLDRMRQWNSYTSAKPLTITERLW